MYLVGEMGRIKSICSELEVCSYLFSSTFSSVNWVVTISQLPYVSKANVHRLENHLRRHTIS